MTPLTRQVMAKSIHRAIIEYQSPLDPKSPLDLRVRAAIYRDSRSLSTGEKGSSKSGMCIDKTLKTDDSYHKSSSAVFKSSSSDSNSRLSPLETVYEQEKDTNTETPDDLVHGNCVNTNYEAIEVSNVNNAISIAPIGETPILVSRKLSTERFCGADYSDNEVWYTPKEFVQSRMVENIEVI